MHLYIEIYIYTCINKCFGYQARTHGLMARSDSGNTYKDVGKGSDVPEHVLHDEETRDDEMKSPEMQSLGIRRHEMTLQHTATHCNTLQHTATHCSTHNHPTKHHEMQTLNRHALGTSQESHTHTHTHTHTHENHGRHDSSR